jgi:hypothetical protein
MWAAGAPPPPAVIKRFTEEIGVKVWSTIYFRIYSKYLRPYLTLTNHLNLHSPVLLIDYSTYGIRSFVTYSYITLSIGAMCLWPYRDLWSNMHTQCR